MSQHSADHNAKIQLVERREKVRDTYCCAMRSSSASSGTIKHVLQPSVRFDLHNESKISTSHIKTYITSANIRNKQSLVPSLPEYIREHLVAHIEDLVPVGHPQHAMQVQPAATVEHALLGATQLWR